MTDLIQIARTLRPSLRARSVMGQPIPVGDRQITPIARSISLTIGRPGGPIALGWTCIRPVAVLETWRGRTRRIPIPDWTRRITLALVASGLLLTLAARYWQKRRKSHTRRGET